MVVTAFYLLTSLVLVRGRFLWCLTLCILSHSSFVCLCSNSICSDRQFIWFLLCPSFRPFRRR
jgi:hypothetical protein